MARDQGVLHTGKAFAEVCDAAELSDAARALRADGQTPRQYIELLIKRKQYPDAVRVLACALPRREAVWWAWVCARRAAGDEPPPPVQTSLEATQKWIAEPVDQHRRTAMQAAEAVGFETPAGCAGLAAFLSGDSLAPAGAEPVPPGEFTAAKAIAGTVVLAAVTADPEQAEEQYRGFVEQGMMVAEKTSLWSPPPPAGGRGGGR